MRPVTVIAGYLGAGKTTLINQMLASSAEPIGVCVNDFGALNIDADLIENSNGITVELSNGCVCCQLGDDLGAALEALKQSDVSHVVIEASGVALPDKIGEYGRSWPGYMLNRVYTLVDCVNMARWLTDKYVGNLVREQMHQGDEILLSKMDAIEPGAPLAWLPTLTLPWQPVPTDNAQVLLDLQTPAARRTVARSMADPVAEKGTVVTYVNGSFATAKQQLQSFLLENPSVIRAKGWFVDEQQQRWLLQHVGTETRFTKMPERSAVTTALVLFHHRNVVLDTSGLASQHQPVAPTPKV